MEDITKLINNENQGYVCVGHTEPVEVCGQAIAHPSTGSG